MIAIVGTTQYLDYLDNPHGIIQGAIGSSLAAGSVVQTRPRYVATVLSVISNQTLKFLLSRRRW
jgi:hypothetical protein